jgi:hypothetical protein
MSFNIPLTSGLFDPQLQLEAEPAFVAAPGWPCLDVVDIHGEISQTIAAIDLLSQQLHITERRRESSLR